MAADLPVRFAAPAAREPSEVLTRTEMKRLDRSSQFALVAAREAWADAGFDSESGVDPERLAVVISSSLGGIQTTFAAHDALRDEGPRRVSPLAIPMLMPNSAAVAVELEVGAVGGAHSPVSACASGAEAIAYGADLIRSGRADVVVAGGTEAPIHPTVIAAFAAARALSTSNDSPATASRPYDQKRDGFVMGEGAAIVVLESVAHARARKARIYGHLLGAGVTSDAYHLTAPEPSGAQQVRAMTLALRQAGLSLDDVGHVNPHATSTKIGDAVESAALRELFGSHADSLIVSATKSTTAHLLGAAGALETVLTVLAQRHRVAPPTRNITELDPVIEIPIQRDVPGALPRSDFVSLTNSFGFGGHNVSLIIGD